ncbi:MAG: DUF4251 domain-containing protein [Bacteroidales bacterium]|nr:DUF4251 domain-containing protein [Bacteroidales bacterium]
MNKMGILTLCAFITAGSVLYAQEKRSKSELRQESTEKVQRLVNAQEYKFVAQYALPMTGRSINLTSNYDMIVTKDSVMAYLPYFGRAYVAPANPSEGGIKFKSADFVYTLKEAKKGGWSAHIALKEANHHYEITLNITTTGSANISVSDNTRQPISFNGYITD